MEAGEKVPSKLFLAMHKFYKFALFIYEASHFVKFIL